MGRAPRAKRTAGCSSGGRCARACALGPVQTRMQWKASENVDAVKYRNSLDAMNKVFQASGAAGLYQGMSAQILKAVLQQAIQFAMKEEIAIMTLRLYVMLAALRGQKS